MSRAPRFPEPAPDGVAPCPWTDAVIARFLDGEIVFVAAGAPGCPDPEIAPTAAELDEHRGVCPACDRALGAARRIDALVAAGAGARVDPAQAQRWLDAAVARAERADPPPVAPRRPVRLSAALLLLALGFGAAWWLRGTLGESKPAASPIAADGAAMTDDATLLRERSGDWLVLPEPSRRRAPGGARTAPTWPGSVWASGRVDALIAFGRRDDLARFAAPFAWLRAALGGAPYWRGIARGAAVAELAEAARVECARRLVESDRREAHAAVRAWLGTWPDGLALRAVLARARRHAGFVTALRAELRGGGRVDPAVVRAAARLGGPEVDAALRRWARTARDRADRIARALAGLDERPGCAALLLDLWRDRDHLGPDDDPWQRACAWFEGVPAGVTAELVDEVRATRNAERRERGLIALAALGDPVAAVALCSLLDSPRRDDARLAAFALGQMPVEEPVLFEHRPRRRPELRLAALAQRQDPRVLKRLAELSLSQEERRFLAVGRFSIEQFDIAAALFRARAPSGE